MQLDPRSSVDHYENFPVASFALPARLRRPVAVIYRFARSADDIADEGDATAAERIAALDEYARELDQLAAGAMPSLPLFKTLGDVIRAHELPYAPFYDLLDAFKQDVSVKRYPTFTALVDYCSRSANPVGLLMLHLYRAATPNNIALSNNVCTALQLINFWQDVAIDWTKDRVYIPQEDLQRFGVTEAQIEHAQADERWRQLFAFELSRAEGMMRAGAPLANRIGGRPGFELRMIVAGGLRIITKLQGIEGDVFNRRPRLGPMDWGRVVLSALSARPAP